MHRGSQKPLNCGSHYSSSRCAGYAPWTADKYVSTVGALALALGIGTAGIASAACASADATDTSTPSASSDTHATPRGASTTPRRSSKPGTTVASADAAANAAAASAGATPRRVTARSAAAPAESQSPPKSTPVVDLPTDQPKGGSSSPAPVTPETPVQASVLPSAFRQTPEPVLSLAPPAPEPAAAVHPAAATASPAVVIPQTAAAIVTATLPQPAASSTGAIAVAAKAIAAQTPIQSFATKVRTLLASLSSALSGKTPAVSVDAALALLFGAAKRQETAEADAKAPTAAAPTPAAAPPASGSTSGSTTSSVEAETLTLSSSTAVNKVSDKAASGKSAVAFSGRGSATATVTIAESTAVTVTAKAANGTPDLTLSIDGVKVTTILVDSSSYATYTFAGKISAGKHVISISTSTATTANKLYIDKIVTTAGPIIDEFTGKAGQFGGSAIWDVRTGTGFMSDSATYTANNVSLDGQGHLVLQATKDKSGRYNAAMVWSKHNMSFGYGTITARVKMPKGQGLWPAVWLMGADSDIVGWPQGGEIDIVELPSTTTTVYSVVHGPIAGTTLNEQDVIVSTLPDLSTAYHDYWVTHLENSITFGIDDITLGTITPETLAPGSEWVYNRPMYMVMNLAVGGRWAGEPDKTTAFPAKMLVESVRYDAA